MFLPNKQLCNVVCYACVYRNIGMRNPLHRSQHGNIIGWVVAIKMKMRINTREGAVA